ncbi:glycosyltransferase family 2 protein [Calditerrivibrio nitroreducens]|uniref:Glycosyl transferase family 2 n=1 Tax=Calditerrivibrio nitroreducens (strain DSM 19672 / NBRC 101217 / Yu37-1) TaxID=768670 RepID=E4TIL5_CALNY|nr:glycosyltransferase family 2 protein [Calditerrivibrio nitroreducens]ADR19063.1 glycosyl transferase family 2 [Calditerrivibrio nitroreducens DSM 19672]
MKKPQVSIGMPVYNGAKFISEALDSLLAQTFTDFELIISDNASTDETEAICREYAAKDKRIRYIRQRENLGAAANFKYVLDQAEGEYFMWAAADDVWDKKWIEKLLPISIINHCIAFGTLQTIDSNSKPLQHPANGRNFAYTGSKFMRRLKYFLEPAFLGKPNPIYGIYPKRLITPNMFSVLASTKFGADMLFMYALLEHVEIRSDMTVLLYKRIHADCAGGGIQTNTGSRSIFLKILTFLFRSVEMQYHYMKDYGSLSTAFERTVHILLFPFILAYSMGEQVMNNLRFTGVGALWRWRTISRFLYDKHIRR